MKIELKLQENKHPITLLGLNNRIFNHLVQIQGLSLEFGVNYSFHQYFSRFLEPRKARIIFRTKTPFNPLRLYSTITNSGYSIKTSKITI